MEPLTGCVCFEYHGYGEEEGGSWTNLMQVSVSANSLTRQQRLERYTSYTRVSNYPSIPSHLYIPNKDLAIMKFDTTSLLV